MTPAVSEIQVVTDRQTWDHALVRLPNAHALQSWDWGEFKAGWGWQPQRFLFQQAGEPLSAAQVLHRRLPKLPFQISYVPKGPALDVSRLALANQVLAALEAEGRRRQSLLVKIDPDVWLGTGADPAPVAPRAQAMLELLRQRGWRPSQEQIQFKNTVMVDLRPDEESLLAAMKPKTRYNIRLAERKGVRVHPGSLADLVTFYHLYAETSRRDGFLIRPCDYYADVWRRFLNAGRAHLLLATMDGAPVAGLMLFVFGDTTWYMYGASSETQRSAMPNYLLQWRAMCTAKELGCSRYDMWGAPDTFDENQAMYGVYRFKTGFGGDTWRGMGAYDFAPSALRYYLYTAAMPRLLSVMRRRRQR